MKLRGPTSRVDRTLLAVNAVLVASIALQFVFPPGPSGAAKNRIETLAELPDFGTPRSAPPDLVAFSEMVERPLFYENRRTPEPPKSVEIVVMPQELQLKLLGVAIYGGARAAVLRNLKNNQVLFLAEGQVHGGWTLESVSSTAARFSRGDELTEISLESSDQKT